MNTAYKIISFGSSNFQIGDIVTYKSFGFVKEGRIVRIEGRGKGKEVLTIEKTEYSSEKTRFRTIDATDKSLKLKKRPPIFSLPPVAAQAVASDAKPFGATSPDQANQVAEAVFDSGGTGQTLYEEALQNLNHPFYELARQTKAIERQWPSAAGVVNGLLGHLEIPPQFWAGFSVSVYIFRLGDFTQGNKWSARGEDILGILTSRYKKVEMAIGRLGLGARVGDVEGSAPKRDVRCNRDVRAALDRHQTSTEFVAMIRSMEKAHPLKGFIESLDRWMEALFLYQDDGLPQQVAIKLGGADFPTKDSVINWVFDLNAALRGENQATYQNFEARVTAFHNAHKEALAEMNQASA